MKRPMLAAALAFMMTTQAFANPPDRWSLFPRFAGGAACIAGWAFFATRATRWGSTALAAYLTANTAVFVFNNFPRQPKN